MRYTAERLMEAGALWRDGTTSVVKRLEAQIDGEELLRYGSAWQEEVRMLREQIATLLAERAARLSDGRGKVRIYPRGKNDA